MNTACTAVSHELQYVAFSADHLVIQLFYSVLANNETYFVLSNGAQ